LNHPGKEEDGHKYGIRDTLFGDMPLSMWPERDNPGPGERIIRRIGPWNEARPPAPPRGQARVSMLTPSGLHFGQAPFDALKRDEMGGPILAAATRLMQALIEKSSGAAA
jgi:hypothetical protein